MHLFNKDPYQHLHLPTTLWNLLSALHFTNKKTTVYKYSYVHFYIYLYPRQVEAEMQKKKKRTIAAKKHGFATRRGQITFPLITRTWSWSGQPSSSVPRMKNMVPRVFSPAAIDTSAICHVKLHSSTGRFMRYTTDTSAKRMATI